MKVRAMTKKATVKEKSQSQKERFIETAKSLDADESGKTFEKAFSKIVPAKRKILHSSDCATNNAPAFPAGACDCGAITGKLSHPS
jgi:hypothetical protein